MNNLYTKTVKQFNPEQMVHIPQRVSGRNCVASTEEPGWVICEPSGLLPLVCGFGHGSLSEPLGCGLGPLRQSRST